MPIVGPIVTMCAFSGSWPGFVSGAWLGSICLLYQVDVWGQVINTKIRMGKIYENKNTPVDIGVFLILNWECGVTLRKRQ